MPGKSSGSNASSRVGDSVALPSMPRNHRNQCKGRTVIRWEDNGKSPDGILHRRGDPILNEDGARQYRPCQGWGANGTDYCAAHGGSAPQTIAAAKRQLALSADDVSRTLIQIAADERIPPETRVKAAAQILDRVGIRLGVDINMEVPGWQKLIGRMFGAPAEAGTEDKEAPAPAPEPKQAPRKAKASPKASKAPKFEGW